MSSIRLTPPVLLFCISERYHNAVFEAQAAATKQMEEARPERLKEHRALFASLIEDRRGQTEPEISAADIQQAIRTIQIAANTGKLQEL